MPTPRRTPTTTWHHAPADTWSRAAIVEAARDWANEFGGSPRSYDWCPGSARSSGLLGPERTEWENQHPRWPGNTTVYRYFATWNELLDEAGLRRHQNHAPGTLRERVDAAQRLSAAGLSVRSIANELEASPGTVTRYLRAHPCSDCGHPVVGDGPLCQPCAGRRGNPKRWTRDEVIAAFREWTELEGRVPTQRDWGPARAGEQPRRWDQEFPKWPPASAVRISFGGTFNELRRHVGAETYNEPWDRQEIIDALKRWNAVHGSPPTKGGWEVATPGYPSAATVRRAFDGSFVTALRAAGLEPRKYRWDRERVVEALRAHNREHGAYPKSTDWLKAAPGRPSYGAVKMHCNTWRAAIAEARAFDAAELSTTVFHQ